MLASHRYGMLGMGCLEHDEVLQSSHELHMGSIAQNKLCALTGTSISPAALAPLADDALHTNLLPAQPKNEFKMLQPTLSQQLTGNAMHCDTALAGSTQATALEDLLKLGEEISCMSSVCVAVDGQHAPPQTTKAQSTCCVREKTAEGQRHQDLQSCFRVLHHLQMMSYTPTRCPYSPSRSSRCCPWEAPTCILPFPISSRASMPSLHPPMSSAPLLKPF